MMLQSSLDWLWKLVVWGGLEFKMYIFKVVWFGFGPVAQTTTKVSQVVWSNDWRVMLMHAGWNESEEVLLPLAAALLWTRHDEASDEQSLGK